MDLQQLEMRKVNEPAGGTSLLMKFLLAAAMGLASANLVAAEPVWQVVHGWPALPEGRVLGSVSGVGIDTAGNVLVFHREGRVWPASDQLDTAPIVGTTVWIFDANSGARIGEWGANAFAMPHGLTVDANDNVWLTDVALHQVFKYTADGKLLLTLGERGVPGDDVGHFNRPTKVAVAKDGSFYVADGYRNARVAKFSPNGEFLMQWGAKGTGPGEFQTVHGIAFDAQGNVYVADRENMRVQVFTADGEFLRQWKSEALGRPYGVVVASDGTALVADGGDQPSDPPDRSALVVLHADGSVAERVGRWGNYDGQFMMAHDLVLGRDGAVYIGDIQGRRVQKFVKVAE